MMRAARVTGAIGLLVVAAVCGFGFLATFEPPGFMGWRIGYAAIGFACIAAAVWLLAGAGGRGGGRSKSPDGSR